MAMLRIASHAIVHASTFHTINYTGRALQRELIKDSGEKYQHTRIRLIYAFQKSFGDKFPKTETKGHQPQKMLNKCGKKK